MDASDFINGWESELNRGATLLDRVRAAARVKAREDALEFGIEQIVHAVRDQTSDWDEALEVGLQRVERRAEHAQQRYDQIVARDPNGELANDYLGYVENARGAVKDFARYAEIYADAFKPLEDILRAAREGVAAQIAAEFPNNGDALSLAEHLWDNTPAGWLEEFDPNDR